MKYLNMIWQKEDEEVGKCWGRAEHWRGVDNPDYYMIIGVYSNIVKPSDITYSVYLSCSRFEIRTKPFSSREMAMEELKKAIKELNDLVKLG